jgi:hypothetical protein
MIAPIESGDENEERIARALELTDAYRILTSAEDEPMESVVTDVLTDLMHLCDNEDLEFDRLLHMATIHHEEEA